MEADKLIDLLNKEREYHAAHPQQVYVKVLSSITASMAAVVASIYFTGKSNKAELNSYLQAMPLGMTMFLFGLGLLLVLIGLAEHNALHGQQRKKIEESLNDVYENIDKFRYVDFWSKHKEHRLNTLLGTPLKKATPLFTYEPDMRGYWKFHDRKFDLGGLLIFIAYAIMIGCAILNT